MFIGVSDSVIVFISSSASSRIFIGLLCNIARLLNEMDLIKNCRSISFANSVHTVFDCLNVNLHSI